MPDESDAASPLPWFDPGVLLATGFGLGYLRPAPGTWGSLLGIPLTWGLLQLPWWLAIAAWILSLPIGWWACRRGARHFAAHDPGGIVVDEYLAIPLAAAPLVVAQPAAPLPWLLTAFALFRLFDITKPGPVGHFDRRGDTTGVMLDDLAAAVLAAGSLAVVLAIA